MGLFFRCFLNTASIFCTTLQPLKKTTFAIIATTLADIARPAIITWQELRAGSHSARDQKNPRDQ